MSKNALLIVDVQNDFLPSGKLPVAKGDEVVPVIDKLVRHPFDLIVASKDYHPKNHLSFASQHPGKKVGEFISLKGVSQILWPEHCVQGTLGSEFAPGWDVTAIDYVVLKGTDPDCDSYSAFFDNQRLKATDLDAYLKKEGVDTLYIAGLATDYCVKYSVLDALELGYSVFVIQDACRGVALKPDDVSAAWSQMESAGAKLISSSDLQVPRP